MGTPAEHIVIALLIAVKYHGYSHFDLLQEFPSRRFVVLLGELSELYIVLTVVGGIHAKHETSLRIPVPEVRLNNDGTIRL